MSAHGFRIKKRHIPGAVLGALITSLSIGNALVCLLPIERPLGVVISVTIYPLIGACLFLWTLASRTLWQPLLIQLSVSSVLSIITWFVAQWRFGS